MGFADIAKGLISVGEGFVSLAEKVVDFAADFLRFVHDIVAAGSKVLEEVLDWAAENLFKIDLLELNGKLDSDFNACVGLKVKCVIVGLRINFDGKPSKSYCTLYIQMYRLYMAQLTLYWRERRYGKNIRRCTCFSPIHIEYYC